MRKPSEKKLKEIFGLDDPQANTDKIKQEIAFTLNISFEEVERRLREKNGLQAMVRDMSRVAERRIGQRVKIRPHK
jgi:hypothetical protein